MVLPRAKHTKEEPKSAFKEKTREIEEKGQMIRVFARNSRGNVNKDWFGIAPVYLEM